MTTTTIPAFSVVLVNVVCPTSVVPGGPSTDPTDIWFPIPDTVPDVPTAPTPDTNPETIPGNSVTTGECFDPDNPDLDQIFNNLLPEEDTDGVPDESLDTGVLLPIDNELVPLSGILRAVASIRNYTYDLVPRITELVSLTKILPLIDSLKIKLEAGSSSFILQVLDAGQIQGYFSGGGSFNLVGQPSLLSYSYPATRVLLASAGSLVVNPPPANVLILAHFDDGLEDEIGIIPGWGYYGQNSTYAPTIDTEYKRFGAASISFDDAINNFSSYAYSYIPTDYFEQGTGTIDFTMEGFLYVTNDDLFFTVFALGNQTGAQGLAVVYVDTEMYVYRIEADGFSSSEVYRAYIGPREGTWIHVVLEQSQSGITLFVNGSPLVNELGETPLPLVSRLDLRNAILLGGYANLPGDFIWQRSRGNIDEFRLVDAAIYNGQPYTVPVEPHGIELSAAGSASFSLGRTVAFESGAYILAGASAGFFRGFSLSTFGGSLTIGGQDANLRRPSLVAQASHGVFVCTGKQIPEVLFVNKTTFATTISATVAWPVGTQIGDLGVLVIETSAAQAIFNGMYPPYGWSAIQGTPFKNVVDLSAPSYMNAFYSIYDGISNQFKIPTQANHCIGALVVYRNINPTDPFVEIKNVESPSGTSVTFPALAEYIPRTKLLYIGVGGQDSSLPPTFSGMTNPEARWVWNGPRAQIGATDGDGGSVMIDEGATKSDRQGLASTVATSSETSNLLLTCAFRPVYWEVDTPSFIVDAGLLVLSGQSVVLRKNYVVISLAGTFDLAGQAAAFVYGKILAGSAGGVSLAGQGADFTYGRRMAGAAGNVVLAGQTAGLIGPGFTGEAGSFSLSGQPATLKRVLVAGAGSTALSGQAANLLDPNATAYVAAVETADAQDLEFEVVTAIDTFIKGCKSDGIWNAIKASCIMAGARTLAGASTPLKGTAPTNNNFVAGDYNRATGLVGNGSTKYLNTNRAVTADPQNNCHISSYITSVTTGAAVSLGSSGITNTGATVLLHSNPIQGRLRCTNYKTGTINAAPASFAGFSRSSSLNFVARSNGSSETITESSTAYTFSDNYTSHRFQNFYYSSRIAFYSIGESLDLALLDSRVSRLVNEIAFYLNTGLSGASYDIDTLKYINAGYAAGGTLS